MNDLILALCGNDGRSVCTPESFKETVDLSINKHGKVRGGGKEEGDPCLLYMVLNKMWVTSLHGCYDVVHSARLACWGPRVRSGHRHWILLGIGPTCMR